MKPPKDWRISLGDRQTSVLAEVLNCHQVWSWLTKPQRAALRGADEDGTVEAGRVVLRNLHGRGLVDVDGRLTAAGRLVLGWNDDEPGPWRERLKELRTTLSA